LQVIDRPFVLDLREDAHHAAAATLADVLFFLTQYSSTSLMKRR
jgi:hypothetical protein